MANVLLLHLDGVDGVTTTIDDSPSNHSITFVGNAQLDTDQKKFGVSSGLFDGLGDYLSIPDSADWDWGTGDLTIDMWVRFDDVSGNQGFLTREVSGSSYFYFAKEAGNIRFRDYGGTIDISRAVTIVADTFYHIAITRSGSNFRIFLDGVQQGATYVNADAFIDRSVGLLVGGFPLANYWMNGWMDEVHILKGECSWTSDFTPPSAPYGEEPVDEEETLNISESIQFQETRDLGEETLNISEESIFKTAKSFETEETLNISEGQLEIQENFHKEETLNILEEAIISQSLEKIDEIENLFITEDSTIGSIGDIDLIYQTDFRTLLSKIYKYMTNLIVNMLSFKKYNTNLRTKTETNKKYNTDLRIKIEDFDAITVGSLNDFIVKLDGTELTDVDYSTLKIQYNLNKTPSSASFQLARRHDNFNYKLDGVTYSQITDENKIEVYDGTNKLLTAYITQINVLSQTDMVSIVAEDARYKLSRNSMEIEYGGKYEPSEDDDEVYEIFEKNIGVALNEVFSAIDSYINGRDDIPFVTSFVPEHTKTYSDYASLLDSLIRQTANASWYLDENERLRFQKVGSGNIKELSLSSLNGSRYVYDVILSDVNMNKQKSGYVKSLNVKLGKHIIQKWSRQRFSGWLHGYVDFWNSLRDRIDFSFQRWGWNGKDWYCGINKTIYGQFTTSWVLFPTKVVQYQSKNYNEDLNDIMIGSGYPQKTIYLNSYGKKEINLRWEERVKESDEKSYLCYVTDDSYDYTDYALDFANFELSQNNQLQTSANITLLLDSFKYYNIKLQDRINLTNTISSTIYKNNKGFPLNIDSVLIDCSTRIVTLNLTNYGKSWYVKTENFLKKITIPTVRYVMEKKEIIEYS